VTHTYAILDVTAATFREIQTKLEAAGYLHAFKEHDDGTLIIDLHGVALRDEDGDANTPELDRLERADASALHHPTRSS
jgi:hypothetical protein